MGLREEKKRETRQGIVDTAVTLFREQGYDATRIQDVTVRLRISEATFFNYFSTKHAVLEAAADDLLDDTIERLRRGASDDDRPVLQRLQESVRSFAAAFGTDRQLASLLVNHTRFFHGGRSERVSLAHGLLTEALAEGQQRDEVRSDLPAAQLAELYLAFTLAMVNSWVADADGSNLEHRLLLALDVFTAGSALA